MTKIILALTFILAMTGCSTNVSSNSLIPNSSVNVNSSGQASGSVNVAGMNIRTTSY